MEMKSMESISMTAKAAGVSRSTLLYYDRLGLLKPSRRSRKGYRQYSPADVERLKQICLYRQMGIPLREMKQLLLDSGDVASVDILKRRLRILDSEIANLRKQQRHIVELLKLKQLQEGIEMINKDRWVEIMRAAGLSENDMRNWHIQFEKMEPEAHQEFLVSLGIDSEEIQKIREWSRSQ